MDFEIQTLINYYSFRYYQFMKVKLKVGLKIFFVTEDFLKIAKLLHLFFILLRFLLDVWNQKPQPLQIVIFI
jgi:hypothetical protein